MQLVDYSDSESDEPVPSSVRLPRVVAAEQENSTGRAAGRATVSTPHLTLVEPASAGSADKPSQNAQPLRDATNSTTAAPPPATGVQADAPAAEQVRHPTLRCLGGASARAVGLRRARAR